MSTQTTPEPRINVELADAVLAQIAKQPKRWYQGFWRGFATYDSKTSKPKTDCGTAFCFAGWAVELSGGKWLWTEKEFAQAALNDYSGEKWQDVDGDAVRATKTEIEDPKVSIQWRKKNGKDVPVVSASTRARRVLGLTREEADILFNANNKRSHLRSMVSKLKKGEAIKAIDFSSY